MRAAALTLAICFLGGGCGVPTADHPSTAAGEAVPYGLLETDPETTTTLPELASAATTIWLVADDGVVPVTREVVAPPTLARSFDALVTDATEVEARLGLRSAVPEDSLNDVSVQSGVATVDLNERFVRAAPREQLLALAQLVYTAMELDVVHVVRFTLDDQEIEVPRGDGSVSDGPVTRLDYSVLEGRRPSGSATQG